MKTELKGRINLGKKIISELNEIGIFTLEDLKKKGSSIAYSQICINNNKGKLPYCYYLYSLEGAIQNIHWTKFTKQEKKRLVDSIHQSYEKKI
jgi:DNA transformation protein